jgi:TrmH family RNA methyltransferase
MVTTRIRPVQSRQNGRVKQLRTALRRAGELIALEGEHLLLEALRSGIMVETVFVMAGYEDRLEGLEIGPDVEVLSLPSEVFASAVSTESPQPVAALAHAPKFAMDAVFTPAPALVVVAAGLQDPGNLGTLVRSAEAFGATGMVLLPGTVSLWNAKVLRASSGSAFRLPIVSCEDAELLATLRAHEVKLLAAVPRDGTGLLNFRGAVAILVGNEGAGLSQEWIDAADDRITIPCPGPTESLNAAVAGSVLLYEAARQRAL